MRLSTPSLPIAFLLGFSVFSTAIAAAPKKDADLREESMPLFELKPFTVEGSGEIAISIYARSGSDRRYATRFAHSAVEAAYVTIEKNPGRGLVIIGDAGEPHPLGFFERFLSVVRSRDDDPELARHAGELEANLGQWKATSGIRLDDGDSESGEFEIDLEQLLVAFPMPLEGVAGDLYLLGWRRRFDPESVERELRSLSSADLQEGAFEQFDWVFYLPPRETLDQVLKTVVPAVMKKEKMGIFKRAMARAAIFTFKPLIKDAMESLRKGVLYFTVLKAAGGFREGDMEALVGAYVGSQLPKGKIIPGGKRERALDAIRAQKLANDEYAKDPFVVPEPRSSFVAADYARFEGYYGAEGHETKRFFVADGRCFWQEGAAEPVEYIPAEGLLLVSANRDITIEILPADDAGGASVELRKGRFRFTFPPVVPPAL